MPQPPERCLGRQARIVRHYLLRQVGQLALHLLAEVVGAAGLIGIVFAVRRVGTQVTDPLVVARNRQMDAVRLCVIGEQVAVFVAELCVQVQVVQAALLAQGLDLLVDGADVVRRKAGGVVLDGLLRGAQNGLHVKGGVGQRGAQ